MTSSAFLSKETILVDMKNHARQIGNVLGAEVSLLDKKTGVNYLLGYEILLNDNRDPFEVFMTYEGNNREELAPHKKEWSVVHLKEKTNGYGSIGEVFTYIQSKR